MKAALVAVSVVFLLTPIIGVADPEMVWTPAGLAEAGKEYVNWDSLPHGVARRRANYFYYFVMGVAVTLDAEGKLCLPPVQSEQLAATVAKYLNEHPERWEYAPSVLILEALQPSFGCQKSK
jgi:Rap1a immunity proteins